MQCRTRREGVGLCFCRFKHGRTNQLPAKRKVTPRGLGGISAAATQDCELGPTKSSLGRLHVSEIKPNSAPSTQIFSFHHHQRLACQVSAEFSLDDILVAISIPLAFVVRSGSLFPLSCRRSSAYQHHSDRVERLAQSFYHSIIFNLAKDNEPLNFQSVKLASFATIAVPIRPLLGTALSVFCGTTTRPP